MVRPSLDDIAAPLSSCLDLHGKRVLVLVTDHGAESALAGAQIPPALRQPGVEALVIEPSLPDSRDCSLFAESVPDVKTTRLRVRSNPAFGQTRKLGFQYAIEHQFDIVAMLPAGPSLPTAKLRGLIQPLIEGRSDAVFCGASRDGVSLTLSRLLTAVQNRLLGTRFADLHSGCRLYSVEALRRIPFQRNSEDDRFDTDIAVQFVLRALHITDLPIPYRQQTGIGFRAVWRALRSTLRARFHRHNLLYDRKFDVGPPDETYDLKVGYPSSHSMAIAAVKPGGRVLDLGCGCGYVAREFLKRGASVTGIDQYEVKFAREPNLEFHRASLNDCNLPVDVAGYDQIFLLDIIEHLHDPERFMEYLRETAANGGPEVILTTANVAFLATRVMLALGHFNYGRQGILDRTHTRLFTFESIRELLEQSGYEVIETCGVPAPFPKAIGDNAASRFLIRLNQALLILSRGLFAYQIFIRAKAKPTLTAVLQDSIRASGSAGAPESGKGHDSALAA